MDQKTSLFRIAMLASIAAVITLGINGYFVIAAERAKMETAEVAMMKLVSRTSKEIKVVFLGQVTSPEILNTEISFRKSNIKETYLRIALILVTFLTVVWLIYFIVRFIAVINQNLT